MKKLKRNLSLALISLCVLVFSQAMVCFAADGTLTFSDPTGKVGEQITVTVKMDAAGAAIGDGDVTVTYDAAKLEFVSGTNATGGAGTVTLSASGTGTETELSYDMVFKALAEGTTTIDVTSSTAYLFSDETLNLQHGNSTITVEPGDRTTTAATTSAATTGTVDIDGVSYAVYGEFSEALIPDGFTKAAVSYNGSDYNGVQQDVSGKKFLFVKPNGSEDSIMAYFDEENSSLVLADRVAISENEYIFILGKGDGSKLPKTFGETTLDSNGNTFPVWQDSENKDYYLVNAIGPSGEISFYQYDTVDGTYQRYVQRETTATEEKATAGNKLIDKVKSFVDDNMLIVVAVIAVVFFVLVLIIIVMSVIIGKKNSELDELYDEYDDGDAIPKNKKNSCEQFIGKNNSDYEDESDDFIEEDVDFEDENYDYDEFDDYDDFDDYEDEDEPAVVPVKKQSPKTRKASKSKRETRDDEDYDIDFIDL